MPLPKQPVGNIVGIELWDGVLAMGRRAHWNLTNKEGSYCYRGKGGKFDLVHVEVNKKDTKIKKQNPNPEILEQCVAQHGFGMAKKFNILL